MIHHHYERKHYQPGTTLPVEIHSVPCSAPPVLGTEASLHRKATLLPGQKPSVGNLLSFDEHRIAITL